MVLVVMVLVLGLALTSQVLPILLELLHIFCGNEGGGHGSLFHDSLFFYCPYVHLVHGDASYHAWADIVVLYFENN